MVDTPKIKALLAQYDISRTVAAAAIGKSTKALAHKLDTGNFTVPEAEALARLLGADVRELFFASERSPDAPIVHEAQ